MHKVVRSGARLAAVASGALLAAPAAAQAVACPSHVLRWQDDCSTLAGAKLSGLDRLRYIPVGQGWLTLGGEARVRVEDVDANDFGIGGSRGFVTVGRRVFLSGDLHFTPRFRVFVQVAAAEEDGRKPGPRAFDQTEFDATNLFVDLPATVGEVKLRARIGRQEMELSDNRLLGSREGVTIRRAFDGVELEAIARGARLKVFRVRPVDIRRGAFDDRSNPDETFSGLSLDLPRQGRNRVTVYLFDRTRPGAQDLDYRGPERRWTAGARYAGAIGRFSSFAQLSGQWGDAGGKSIGAFGGAAGTTVVFDAPHKPRLNSIFAFASGDGRAGDRRLGTFDPVYPNGYGLSDAPFIYQTNFVFGGAEAVGDFGPAQFGVASYAIGRASTGDAVYAQGRPIPGSVGPHRGTAWLLQANTRMALAPRVDLYVSVVRAIVGRNLSDAGGHDATYMRFQLTSRF